MVKNIKAAKGSEKQATPKRKKTYGGELNVHDG